jgi:hypothetical protein
VSFPRRLRRQLATAALALVLVVAVAATGRDGAGAPDPTFSPRAARPSAACDRYASPRGSNANRGRFSAPFAGAQKLLDSLRAGQTGCLRAGTYTVGELRVHRSGRPGAPITLTSAPGERARIVTRTDFYLPSGISHITFQNLDLTNAPASRSLAGVMIQDFSSSSTWIGNDISGSARSTCMQVGSVAYGTARHTVIRANRIHDCGNPADRNQDHAIYVAQSRGATITDNVIWNAAAYAVHLYPRADATTVTHNVIDASGYGGVMFAGDRQASDNNTVAYNVITGGARYGLDFYWGGREGTGNAASHNCFHDNAAGDTDGEMAGVAVSANTDADPRYADPAAHDYRLPPGSPCLSVVGYDAAARLGF